MFSSDTLLIEAFTRPSDKGTILIYENDKLPFIPKRMFWIRDVPKLSKRGGHAHKQCEQFIICVNGGIDIRVYGKEEGIYLDDSSCVGLYIPPMNWIDIRFLRPKSKIVVLCSHGYSEEDYIRNFNDYVKLVNPV